MAQAQHWAGSSAPEITSGQLVPALQEHWGLTGELEPLYAERDFNARLRLRDGSSLLIKASHPDTDPAQLDFQDRAFMQVERHAPELPVPRLLRSHSGAARVAVRCGREQIELRVFTWLEGRALALNQCGLPAAAAAGAALAKLGRALSHCPGDGAPAKLPWDLQGLQSLWALARALTPGQGRRRVEQVLQHHAEVLRPALSALPRQVIHNDLNPDNILFQGSDPPRVSGLIDFGDLVVAPLVCDLAVATAYLVNPQEPADPFSRVLAATGAYLDVQPLDGNALSLLPDLIACRQAMSLLIQGYRVAQGRDPSGTLAAGCANARQRLEASFSDAGQRFREQLAELQGRF